MDFLVPWIQLLVPQPCYDEFFVKLNFFDVACLKVVISKGLGYAIILGSVMVKLPQIVKIFGAKSAKGISLPSVLLELVCLSVSLAYGFANSYPFSSYGEGLFLSVQTALIAFCCFYFAGQQRQAFSFVSVFASVLGILLSDVVPMNLLWALQASNMPITSLSKMIQVMENYRNGSTGQISFITITLLFLGAIARIFTSIQETGDMTIIYTYVIASLCNGILFTQVLYYWNADKTKKE